MSEKQEQTPLKVGDVVYCRHSVYTKLYRHKVVRTTKTQAVLDSKKKLYIIPSNGWYHEIGEWRDLYRKETPALKEEYTRQTLSERIEAAILDSLTTDQLQAICDIIDPPKQQ